jgi:hypothetical protein
VPLYRRRAVWREGCSRLLLSRAQGYGRLLLCRAPRRGARGAARPAGPFPGPPRGARATPVKAHHRRASSPRSARGEEGSGGSSMLEARRGAVAVLCSRRGGERWLFYARGEEGSGGCSTLEARRGAVAVLSVLLSKRLLLLYLFCQRCGGCSAQQMAPGIEPPRSARRGGSPHSEQRAASQALAVPLGDSPMSHHIMRRLISEQ